MVIMGMGRVLMEVWMVMMVIMVVMIKMEIGGGSNDVSLLYATCILRVMFQLIYTCCNCLG